VSHPASFFVLPAIGRTQHKPLAGTGVQEIRPMTGFNMFPADKRGAVARLSCATQQ
jgi:hypothetical protein